VTGWMVCFERGTPGFPIPTRVNVLNVSNRERAYSTAIEGIWSSHPNFSSKLTKS